MKKIALTLVLFFCINYSFAQPHLFNRANYFFFKYVRKGNVNYKAIKEKPQLLNDLIRSISSHSLIGKSEKYKKAFYINAYNISVIKSVVLTYPIKSVMDKKGFFDQKEHRIAGKFMTLNYLENEIIRPKFKDPRIHFALVCAAKSCPPLYPFAFYAENVEDRLETVTKKALNNDEFIQLNSSSKTVAISKIFERYKGDFPSIISFINNYRNTKIPTDYKLSYYEYNWTLNE